LISNRPCVLEINSIYSFKPPERASWSVESALPVLFAFLLLSALFYLLLYAPLARLAEVEAQRYALYPHRTSAREQLHRRGSF